MIDLKELLESEFCTALALDDKKDREYLSLNIKGYLSRGVAGINQLKKENFIGDADLEAALVLAEFMINLGHELNLPLLSAWAVQEYTSLQRVEHNRKHDGSAE